MAKCGVCGRWAGFFRKVHESCVAPAETQEPEPAAKRPTVEVRATVLPGASLPQITLHVNRPHRIIHIAQLHAVLMAAVGRAGIQDAAHQLSAGIAAKLLQVVAGGGTEREFLEWCKTPGSGVSTSGVDWHRLFFWAGLALDAAEKYAVQMWDGDVDEVFPYFELWSDACRVPGHAALNNFVAARRDPVWQYLWPPNDWLCGCTLISLLQSEGAGRADADVPGCQRVEEKFLNRALSWYQRSPRPVMKSVGW